MGNKSKKRFCCDIFQIHSRWKNKNKKLYTVSKMMTEWYPSLTTNHYICSYCKNRGYSEKGTGSSKYIRKKREKIKDENHDVHMNHNQHIPEEMVFYNFICLIKFYFLPYFIYNNVI